MKKQIFNPYLPNYEYIPDGEPRVFEGRLYVYGSHDSFGSPFLSEAAFCVLVALAAAACWFTRAW